MTYLIIARTLHGKPTFHLCYAEPDYNHIGREKRKQQTCFELTERGERLDLSELRALCLHGGLKPCYVKRIVNQATTME